MIYVLVPARDEAQTVGLLLWKIRQVFTAFAREYQILVANDGSTDATDDILGPYTRALPLTVITHRKSLGYARSLEALFRLALQRTDRPRRDLAITLQGDFTDAPDDIPEFVKRLEGGADLVVANRRFPVAGLANRILPRALQATLRIPGGRAGVSTMRAYRLGVLERLMRECGTGRLLEREGRSADVELLVRAARYARRVETVDVTGPGPERQRGSRAAPTRDAWTAWRTALALRGAHQAPAAAAPTRSGATPVVEEPPAAPPPRERRAPVGTAAADARPARRGRRGRGGRGRRGGPGQKPRGDGKAAPSSPEAGPA